MDPVLYKNTSQTLSQIDFESLKKDLFTLFRSPNPLAIYLKSAEIKNKFSFFLNELSTKVSAGFDLSEDSQSFIYGIYKMANYQNIWIYNLENYLRESKNFDLLFYLYATFILNPEQKNLAIGLLKKYKWATDKELQEFLSFVGSTHTLQYISWVYEEFWIQNMEFSIHLREDFVEHFIEKMYLSLPEKKANIFLDHFILKINKKQLDFQAVTRILQKVISNYATNGKAKNMYKTVEMQYFHNVKTLIDDLIGNYHSIRGDFYSSVISTLEDLPLPERSIFWLYIKTKMIDIYFWEIKLLFYEFSSTEFLNKDTFANLKWTVKIPQILSEKSQFIYQDYMQLVDLKNLIVELQNNLFSFFLLPIIYYTISEKITFPKKDLYKLKYVLLFIFSSNYGEYKKIYMFFNQLEIFLNYERQSNVFAKIQVSFSLVVVATLILLFSYYYLPIWVFIWLLVWSCIRAYEVIFPNIYYNIKWNFWIKFFAIMFLCISSYFWFQNFEQIKKDGNDIAQKIEFLWKLPTSTTIESGLKHIKASLFDAFWNAWK